RERAETAALAFTRRRGPWRGVLAAFQRRDKDLVDWTFLQGAPFARQANAVDIDVTGFEAGLERRGPTLMLVAGYSYLDKEADYGTASVDASYYALNYATHRLTLAWEITPTDHLTFRWDNEFRRQADNPLRSGSRDAYQTSMALDWVPPRMPRLSTSLRVDNLTNSNFEEFPGTPAARRRVSVKARWSW
ncbi:MAG: TonB-dependent receptor, partial [Pseudomonadota bacterium]